MKSSCIIIEDEPLARERLAGFIERVPYLELTGEFGYALEALSYLRGNDPALIFLDINMDGFSGIQLLKSVSVKGHVVITTAYDQYALQGYELNVTDYLLKPYTFERFLQAVEKVRPTAADRARERKHLFIKTENRLEKVFIDDILYIEGMRDYRRVHTPGKRIMTQQTFGSFEQTFPPHVICRVHKSWMVAIDKIETVERDRIRVRDLIIPISESYRKRFFELIAH